MNCRPWASGTGSHWRLRRAARVLAGLRDGMVVTQLPALHATLDKVPVRRAALPGDAGERLQHMGVRTLAAVRALPRDGLRRRFGAGLLEHLDRLYGQVDDPWSATRHRTTSTSVWNSATRWKCIRRCCSRCGA